MRSNYHTHTYRCNHATGTIEDYVKEAIKANIDEIGISDHLPHPGKNIDNYHRMAYEDLEDYFGKIEEAIEKLDMVAEGVRTTKVCYFLSKKYNVYMPITENIYKVLYEGLSINECVNNLMKKMAAEELNKFE